jgi:hypothetical protein
MHVSRAHCGPCITPRTAQCCGGSPCGAAACCGDSPVTMRSRLLSLPSRMADVPAELLTPLPLHARSVLLQAATRTYEDPSSTRDTVTQTCCQSGSRAAAHLGALGFGAAEEVAAHMDGDQGAGWPWCVAGSLGASNEWTRRTGTGEIFFPSAEWIWIP